MKYKKYYILSWNTILTNPVKGRLLLIKHCAYLYSDYRFALFSLKDDNEYYQVFPDEPSHGPIKLYKNDIILWSYLPEDK